MENLIQTGFLQYFINTTKVKAILELHPLKEEILKFKPKNNDRKSYLRAYNRFILHIDKLDLSKYGFRAETTTSEFFGTKTFYKTDFQNFFYSEIFEAVHLKLV